MRFLSLFSGIEAASVAWHPLGWTPVAFAEIEPFPCAVLKHHYPIVPNLGNVSAITKSQIDALMPIDVVVFGFPCQDLSVAGKREGLVSDDGTATRSGLFFDAMRIVEWSGARWSVAENVPGLFSSKGGRDFAAVVGTLAGVEFDVPPSGWKNIGVAAGPKGLVEWCVLDAQWFGLAQRRKRVFIVRDTGNWRCRPPLLFKSDSLSGDLAPSRETGKDVAVTVTGRTGNGSRQSGANGNLTTDVSATVSSKWAKGTGGPSGDECQNLVAVSTPGCAFCGYQFDVEKLGRYGCPNCLSEGLDEVSCTLPASNGGASSGMHPVIPIDMRQASRGATMTNNRGDDVSSGGAPGTGIGEPDDPSPSVSLSHPPAVAYQCHGSNVGEMGTLRAGNGNTAGGVPFTFGWNKSASQTMRIDEETTDTLQRSPSSNPAVAFTQNSREEVRIIGEDGSVAGAIGADEGMKQRTYLLTSQGGLNASTQETDSVAILRRVRDAIGEEAFAEWGLGILDPFYPPEVLRSALHGSELRPATFSRRWMVDCALSRPEDLPERALCSLREAQREGRSPQRPRLSKQHARELGAYLSRLSQPGAQAACLMHDLRQAGEGIRVLFDALSAIQNYRRPSDGKDSGEKDVCGDGVPEDASREGVLQPTLTAGETGHDRTASENKERGGQSEMAIRRLTPTECEFLMGFPRSYTNVPFRGKPAADGNRYKALGNSMAVPVVRWIGERIALVANLA